MAVMQSRQCIELKWAGGYNHSASTSSISKMQFGGTKLGCTAAMSQPMTSAAYLSAMSWKNVC